MAAGEAPACGGVPGSWESQPPHRQRSHEGVVLGGLVAEHMELLLRTGVARGRGLHHRLVVGEPFPKPGDLGDPSLQLSLQSAGATLQTFGARLVGYLQRLERRALGPTFVVRSYHRRVEGSPLDAPQREGAV